MPIVTRIRIIKSVVSNMFGRSLFDEEGAASGKGGRRGNSGVGVGIGVGDDQVVEGGGGGVRRRIE